MKFGDFRQRDNECLHHLYWYAMSACSVPTPHTVQVWSIVYRCQGHAKCLLLDKRTSPHFLFYFNPVIGDEAEASNLVIMKKSLSILGSFCLGLFISIAVIACADDDGTTNPLPTPSTVYSTYPKVLQMTHSEYDEEYTFYYDEKGRICRVHYFYDGGEVDGFHDEYTEIVYSNNEIKINEWITKVEDLENLSADAINAFVMEIYLCDYFL